jgi:hypothetical protein
MGSDEKAKNIQLNPGPIVGPIWCIGWLFTVAFAKLIWWKAVLAIVIWPYFLGVAAR